MRLTAILASLAASLCLAVPGAAAAGPVRVEGAAFKDSLGRTLILRGVNLGGSSKIPARTSSDPKEVSFVGRPFPLAEADEHFRRLQGWGLTVERLIVPWEAIEHAGPGEYDKDYLDYLHELVKRADRYGIKVVIDLHQDFYSRASGGDGAPYWTLTRLGLQPDRTHEPGGPQQQPPRGPGYWPATVGRLSADTMDTLFWAGDEFAPGLKVDGVPVQHWLQDHYLGAMRQVALRLDDLDNVVGYDTYNEPAAGFIGVPDLRGPELFSMVIGHYAAPDAPTPTYWDLMRAAAGYAPDKSSVPVNRLWGGPAQDIWRRYGVWDVVNGQPTLLKPDYFAKVAGQTPNHGVYLARFYVRLAASVREVAPNAVIFQESSTAGAKDQSLGLPGIAYEPHFYDSVSMLTKQSAPDTTWPMFAKTPISGRDAVLESYVGQINGAKSKAQALGGVPTWFGETGVPYDVNDKAAYRTGDFSSQKAQAALMYEALDRTLSSYAIWCYTADNSNRDGDHWNNEDYSIYSPDQRKAPSDINSGGRASDEVVRPYPLATAGTPRSISFDPQSKTFVYTFTADETVKASTEIFLPAYQYPHGVNVEVKNAAFEVAAKQSRLILSRPRGEVTVRVTPAESRPANSADLTGRPR